MPDFFQQLVQRGTVVLLFMATLTLLAFISYAHAASDMVLVPQGEFFMGTPADGESFDDEHPQRKVFLSAFWIDRFEVTNEAYERFVRQTGHRIPENANPAATLWENRAPIAGIADHPVINIGWDDAVDYCRWAGKRLPTEAEWEKAARGTDGRRYPWGNDWNHELANSASYWAGRTIQFKSGSEWEAFWINGDGARISKERGVKGEILTLPVGSFPGGVSPYGLHDMAGNASEWVNDWYDPDYYTKASLIEPPGSERGAVKAMRGGSWLKPAKSLRTSDRDFGTLQARPSGAGFRCAKDAY
jgi:formylglycine-generating enzyme required for sulfatase activity